MENFGDQVFWEFIGLIFAATATLIGILGSLSNTAQRLLQAWRARIRRKNIKGLLLPPTSEELARYSVQVPPKYHPDELLFMKIERQQNKYDQLQLLDPDRLKAEGWIIVLIVFFLAAFTAVAIRFFAIGMQQYI